MTKAERDVIEAARAWCNAPVGMHARGDAEDDLLLALEVLLNAPPAKVVEVTIMPGGETIEIVAWLTDDKQVLTHGHDVELMEKLGLPTKDGSKLRIEVIE